MPDSHDEKARKWARVRFLFGQAQVLGATITLYFLLVRGERSALTLGSALVTAVISGVSVYLFRFRKKR